MLDNMLRRRTEPPGVVGPFPHPNEITPGLLIMADNSSTFIELTASIVSAYVSNNSVPSTDLPALIGQVHTALARVSSGHAEALGDAQRPAIPVKKSIMSDYIICLEDGKKFKSL
jgi:predicted transcriptional regulator